MKLDFEEVEYITKLWHGCAITLRTPISAEKLVIILNEIRKQNPNSTVEIDVNENTRKIVIDVIHIDPAPID